ncbi:type II toxin-antitoxin system RelE/ParE family toxin [Congregibacter sp.]|uniref:type II toxin-antitoxin system RelE/ParE family toxin n=1 Tax=Congregibacter sp. TaxID=2744308 RepID=UPI003F6C96BF
MWSVFEHKRLDKQLEKAPLEVQKRYEKWKDVVELSGPDGLGLIRGFRDEALRGKWKGYRSSRLNKQYRVIYKVQGDRLEVFVVDVTPHDYRRRS